MVGWVFGAYHARVFHKCHVDNPVENVDKPWNTRLFPNGSHVENSVKKVHKLCQHPCLSRTGSKVVVQGICQNAGGFYCIISLMKRKDRPTGTVFSVFQLFSWKLAWQLRQVTVIFPFPRGTRKY